MSPGTTVWLNPDERHLTRLLDKLEPLRRSLTTTQRRIEDRARQNRLTFETAQRQIAGLRATLQAGDVDDKQRRRIEQQIRDLEQSTTKPADLFALPEIRRQLIEMTNLRQRLALTVLEIPRRHQQMIEAYRQLAQQPRVRQALGVLGESHVLGPLQQGYRSELKRLNQYREAVQTDWLPAFRQSDQIRFGGIVNDRIPALFSWHKSHEPTLLTGSVVQAAGLSVADDAEAITLPWADGRRLITRPLTVPILRFGAIKLKDAPVLVLPPEGEDIGSWIGPAGFAEFNPTIQPDRMRILLHSP
jgi:hypothetical protein